MSHGDPGYKKMVKGTVDCSNHPGATFSVTAYVVYSETTAYEYLTKSFTCAASSGTSTTTAAPVGGTTAAGGTTAVGGTSSGGSGSPSPSGQFSSLGMISFEWTPYLLSARSASAASSRSDIQVYFNLQTKTKGWVGLGFGYNDYKMTGGKKAIVLRASGSNCYVEFYTLVSQNIQAVSGGVSANDPWGVNPACSFLTPSMVSLSFSVGGSSSITLPAKGTSMYVLVAGVLGTDVIGNHGSSWDYKKIDLLTGSSSGSSSSSGDVNPYYLWHGIVLILNYAILMPVTSFLILIDRNKFFNIHKWIGVVIVALLIAGWVLLNPAKDASRTGGYDLLSGDAAGRDHGDLGSAGLWIAVGVCALGVVLWFIRLPQKMRKGVRYAHGIVGIALSFFGPYVVWTGWVRLAPAQTAALLNTPWVWLSLAITLGAIYVAWYALNFFKQDRRRMSGKLDAETYGKSAEMDRVFTPDEIQGLVASGKLILIVDGVVCEIPKKFSHPGGRAILEQFSGQEVGPIMAGLAPAEHKGRSKYFPHSSDAFKEAKKMRIGLLVGAQLEGMGASAPEAADAGPQTARIVSKDVINRATDFPVRLFRLALGDAGQMARIERGSRVYISVPGVCERPYTVCGLDRINCVIEFAIKIYPSGQLTPCLNRLAVGDSVVVSRPVAHPAIPAVPNSPSLVVFIAGGTGMTPMISYFGHLAKVPLGGVLLWWVRHEEDLFLLKELKEWSESKNLRVCIYLTAAAGDASRVGFPVISGRVSGSKILEAFGGDLPVNAKDISWIMSGPEGFIGATEAALEEVGARKTRILSLD